MLAYREGCRSTIASLCRPPSRPLICGSDCCTHINMHQRGSRRRRHALPSEMRGKGGWGSVRVGVPAVPPPRATWPYVAIASTSDAPAALQPDTVLSPITQHRRRFDFLMFWTVAVILWTVPDSSRPLSPPPPLPPPLRPISPPTPPPPTPHPLPAQFSAFPFSLSLSLLLFVLNSTIRRATSNPPLLQQCRRRAPAPATHVRQAETAPPARLAVERDALQQRGRHAI